MFKTTCFLLLVACTTFTECYTIAKDCTNPINGKDRSDMLKNHVDEAIRLSRLAGDELDKVIQNAPDADPNVKNAAGYLFKPSLYSFVRDKFRNLLQHSAQGFINTAGDQAQDPRLVGNNQEVVIYCTQERWEYRGPGDTWVDKDWKYDIPGSFYKQCFVNDTSVLAGFVNRPDVGTQARPSAIQLCPWYLEKNLDDPPKCPPFQDLLEKFKEKFRTASKKTADGYRTFVGGLIHELTHTDAGGRLEDSYGPGADHTLDPGNQEIGCYFWANCVRGKNAQNADNYLQLAMMVNIIKNCGLTPTNEDGDIAKIKGWKPPQ